MSEEYKLFRLVAIVMVIVILSILFYNLREQSLPPLKSTVTEVIIDGKTYRLILQENR